MKIQITSGNIFNAPEKIGKGYSVHKPFPTPPGSGKAF